MKTMVTNRAAGQREKVSIIIPLYNAERYIEKCITSILEQTYADFEMILVDDGSMDDSGKICDAFAEKDSRIMVIHKKNEGISAARNAGLAAASGRYIAFVDSDDWIEPTMLEVLVTALKKHDADVACCGIFHEFPQRKDKQELTNEEVTFEGGENAAKALLSGKTTSFMWNKIYKKELFKTDDFFPVGRIYEDMATLWKLMLDCNRIACVPGLFYHYRRHRESAVNTRSLKNIEDEWIASKERWDYFERYRGISKEWNSCCDYCLRECLDTVWIAWRWAYDAPAQERKRYSKMFKEMSAFAREHRSLDRSFSRSLRIGIWFASYNNALSMITCYAITKAYRKVSKF